MTNWSYGELLRSEAYHAIDGRAHVDFGHSFIAREGGIEGLIEVSRMSGIPLQDLSRLSPGSAISAIQIRQSMEDGVLVPWKKTGQRMSKMERICCWQTEEVCIWILSQESTEMSSS